MKRFIFYRSKIFANALKEKKVRVRVRIRINPTLTHVICNHVTVKVMISFRFCYRFYRYRVMIYQFINFLYFFLYSILKNFKNNFLQFCSNFNPFLQSRSNLNPSLLVENIILLNCRNYYPLLLFCSNKIPTNQKSYKFLRILTLFVTRKINN
jgi:hypothetical protein